MATPVIDMWAPVLPVPEIMFHIAENFPDGMLGYLRVFWKQRPSQEALRAGAPAMARSLSDVVAALDAASITRTLITGFDELSTAGKTFIPNALVAPIAERHPDRFIPFAGVDIMQGLPALRELEHWVRERRFRGLSLRPFMIGLPADDCWRRVSSPGSTRTSTWSWPRTGRSTWASRGRAGSRCSASGRRRSRRKCSGARARSCSSGR